MFNSFTCITNNSHKIIILILLAFIFGCSAKPQFYPNAHLQEVGQQKAQSDINDCTNKANEYLQSPTAKKMLSQGASGSIIGGVVGAINGLFTGNVAREAARGAAIGGAAGATSGAISPDTMKRNFINKCLQEEGYQIIGWQ